MCALYVAFVVVFYLDHHYQVIKSLILLFVPRQFLKTLNAEEIEKVNEGPPVIPGMYMCGHVTVT